MCGIAGFQGRFGSDLLRSMGSILAHRGPDDSGEWESAASGVGLAHRRLSIIDLSQRGHEPMVSQDGACVLSYNGEIYNYVELREELRVRGRVFQSETDTEVLLQMYEEYGLDALKRLNGIFAFAIWDERESTLFVARDQLGVKPLYYAETPSGFLFGSELKALLLCPEVDRSIDPIALDQHLAFQWAVAPRTIVSGVSKLEPGSAMLIKDGAVSRKWRYYELPYGQAPMGGSEEEIAEQLRSVLATSVERQMVSDVPVGAFLSGGLDSSAVVAMARQSRPDYRMPCYSIGFKEDDALDGNPADLPFARKVAERLDVDFRTITLTPEVISHLEKMIYYLDEPQGDPAPINASMIAEQARADGVPVLLSGAGGDDVFSGYRRHYALYLERMWSWLPGPARSGLGAVSRAVPLGGVRGRRLRRAFQYAGHPADERLLTYFLWTDEGMRRDLLSHQMRDALSGYNTLTPLRDSLAEIEGEKHPLNRMLFIETRHFLADHNLNYTDKTAMAHAIEVRVPLIDPDMVDFAARIPVGLKQKGKQGKYIFKRAMEPYLDHDVIYRAKTGFGAPIRRWVRQELTPLIDDVLADAALQRRGMFSPSAVRKLIEDDRAGRVDAAYTVYAILCLELWARVFLDRAFPAN
jgi:asparagine synthase (glutamine-hydrolysing)